MKRFIYPKTIIIFAVILTLCLLSRASFAQDITYTIESDRNVGSKSDLFTITITLQYPDDDDLEKIQLPELSNFDQIDHGSSKQMSLSIINGRRSASETRIETFVLRPKNSGTLKIENGYIQYDRKIYKSNSIEIRVLDNNTSLQNQLDHQNDSDEPTDPNIIMGPDPSETKLFVRYKISANEIYVGEQVNLEVWLFTREGLEIQNIKTPKHDGFWFETIKLQKSDQMAQNATVGGTPYHAYLLSRQILFPLTAKNYQIEPTIVEAVTGGSFFSIGRKIIRQTQPISLIAKALPAPIPNGFHSQNVGQFSIKAEVNKNKSTQGEPITLLLHIEGNGNYKNIQIEQKPSIINMKFYDPTVSTSGDFVQGFLFGKKTFEYLVVPQKQGDYQVGPFSMTYFDPTNHKYETIRTQPIAVHISDSVFPNTHNADQKPVVNQTFSESKYRPLYVGSLTASPNHTVPDSWILLLSVSPLFSLFIIMITVFFRLLSQPEKIKRLKRIKHFLSEIKSAEAEFSLINRKQYQASHETILNLFLKMNRIAFDLLEFHFGSQVRSATHKDISELLQKYTYKKSNGFSGDIPKQVLDLLTECDVVRFAPSSASTDRAKQHIQTLYHLHSLAKHR